MLHTNRAIHTHNYSEDPKIPAGDDPINNGLGEFLQNVRNQLADGSPKTVEMRHATLVQGMIGVAVAASKAADVAPAPAAEGEGDGAAEDVKTAVDGRNNLRNKIVKDFGELVKCMNETEKYTDTREREEQPHSMGGR